MAKKFFTDESLKTLIDEMKSYADNADSKKANASHSHSISEITNLQTSLDSKQASITGGASTIASSNLTANRALISNGSGKVAVSAVTSTELGYLDGVTSNIQTQLDNKVPSSRTVNGKALSSNISLSYSDVGASASSHTHSYLPLSGGNLTGTLGIGNKYELSPAYNFINGCLIDIGAAKSSTMVAIHVTGNSYNSSTSPIDSLFQFYDYGDGTIMNYSGVNLGLTLGAMTVYRYNNRLYAYIKQTADYQTLSFTLLTNKSGLTPSISNTSAHTSGYTDRITITPKNVSMNGHTHSYAGSSSVGGAANSAVKATQDANGNVITSTYATKTELDTTKSTLQTSIDSKSDSGHTHTIANITNLQTTLDGKSNTSHTHNYAASSSAGGAATSANKVNKTLTVQLNGGTTEGTNKFTFDGSSAKSFNITPSTIGASASSHTHDDKYYTETEIDTKLSGKANSSHGNHVPTTQTASNKVFLRNDNTWATITPANIGAAASSHNHTVSNITDLTATATELNYMDGVTSNVQTQLDGKAASSHNHTITASASDDDVVVLTGTNGTNKVTYSASHANSGVTAGTYKSVTVNAKGHITAGSNPTTLSGYGITNAYTKTEVDTIASGKADTHTHPYLSTSTKYAASASVGGSATSAVKLDTSTAGDSNTPVYFTGGKPVACTSLDLNTSGSSASCTGNSATATKLQTARKIGLSTGATGTATNFDGTGDITIPVTDVKESYLSWGGKNLVGSVSPIGAALSTEHSANRIAYLNPAAIKVEYSNDAGSTWTDSGLGNSAKINFVTTSNGISVGSNSTVTTSHRTRVTLTAQDGTNGYIYTRPRKMLINVSTAGHGLTVTVEVKTGVSGANWTTLGTYELNGWSGWNDIPMSISTFGGGTNQTGNYWYMRLTFATTSVSSSYTTTKSSIIGLRLFGDTCWTRTSNMGETGHLYSYDASQNATFPANVTATTFVGALSGNATTATTATNVAWSGVTSKPSYYDAKAIKGITRSGTTFTYTCMDGTTGTFTQQDNNTTYSVATTSANGLMSASDKTKLNTMELATLTEVQDYLGI